MRGQNRQNQHRDTGAVVLFHTVLITAMTRRRSYIHDNEKQSNEHKETKAIELRIQGKHSEVMILSPQKTKLMVLYREIILAKQLLLGKTALSREAQDDLLGIPFLNGYQNAGASL